MTNDLDDFAEFLKAAVAEGRPPCTSLYICHEGQAVELHIDRTCDYGDWIKGEGADICLYRELDTNHVVGVRLPLRHERLVVTHSRHTVVFPDYPRAAAELAALVKAKSGDEELLAAAERLERMRDA